MDNNETQQVQSNIGLVVKLARGFKPRSKEELDDLVQIGTIGLLKAIRTHDPKIAKLTTWAWKYIRWEIMRYLNIQPLNLTSQDMTIDNIPSSFYTNDVWEYLPDTLSKVEKQTVFLKLEGYNFEDIAKKLGYTRGWTNKLYKSALRKIEYANKS